VGLESIYLRYILNMSLGQEMLFGISDLQSHNDKILKKDAKWMKTRVNLYLAPWTENDFP